MRRNWNLRYLSSRFHRVENLGNRISQTLKCDHGIVNLQFTVAVSINGVVAE